MNISIITGETARQKLCNFASDVKRMHAEIKALDAEILVGSAEAAIHYTVLNVRLGALNRHFSQLEKDAERERAEGVALAKTIRANAERDYNADKISVDEFEAAEEAAQKATSF